MGEEDKKTPKELQREGNARLRQLASEARPAEVSEVRERKLFEEWERSTITIGKAKQMLTDSIAYQQKCAEEIVRTLGVGKFRYKDQLLSVSAKGNTVYLRALAKKPAR